MSVRVELLLSPADMAVHGNKDLADTTCVVFDVLRATSTIAMALDRGAREVVVVESIDEALRLRHSDPDLLLAGERDGRRISAGLTGSIEFDFGNSPREFAPDKVADRRIVMTTTNGTRALRACHGSPNILAAALLNLGATVQVLRQTRTPRMRIICAGTGEHASFEDILGAGALMAALPPDLFTPVGDACQMAAELYASNKDNLEQAFGRSANGRRLLALPELAPDVAFCARQNILTRAVRVDDHVARRLPAAGLITTADPTEPRS